MSDHNKKKHQGQISKRVGSKHDPSLAKRHVLCDGFDRRGRRRDGPGGLCQQVHRGRGAGQRAGPGGDTVLAVPGDDRRAAAVREARGRRGRLGHRCRGVQQDWRLFENFQVEWGLPRSNSKVHHHLSTSTFWDIKKSSSLRCFDFNFEPFAICLGDMNCLKIY